MIMEKSCTIQDVFERFYPSYEKRNSPPAHHRKTAYHIMNCKTGAFGVNISVCEDCGCISIHNNSCRSRCCPMCQEFPKEKWIDAQKENVLDAPYYHVVFTVPEELNPIIIAIRNFCMMHCIMLHHPLWTSWRKIQSIWELTSDISVFFIHGVLQ